jgi:hypothetical protein
MGLIATDDGLFSSGAGAGGDDDDGDSDGDGDGLIAAAALL